MLGIFKSSLLLQTLRYQRNELVLFGLDPLSRLRKNTQFKEYYSLKKVKSCWVLICKEMNALVNWSTNNSIVFRLFFYEQVYFTSSGLNI